MKIKSIVTNRNGNDSRNHGPIHFIQEHGVFLRTANIEDADQLIALNKAFRAEMMQWEVGLGRSSPVYPVLDMEDLDYILNEEESSNLIVLGRKGGNDRLLGYSYAYMEPWGGDSNRKSRKQNGRRGGKQNCSSHSGKSKSDCRSAKSEESEDQKSLYIAELFVVESERGLGFGELLLCETLRQNSSLSAATRSHLYVSSRNISAVKCYGKFGYVRSQKPSGDDVHDLVMELDNAQRSATESALRLEQRVVESGIGERRQRTRSSPVPALPHGPSSPTPHHHHFPCAHQHTPEPSGSPRHSPRMCPTQFAKKEDGYQSGIRPLKNYSAGCKRQSKTLSRPKIGCVLKETSEAKNHHGMEAEAHLIVGDLFEINTRHHGGYDRRQPEENFNSLRADPSASAFDGTTSLDGHRRKKREVPQIIGVSECETESSHYMTVPDRSKRRADTHSAESLGRTDSEGRCAGNSVRGASASTMVRKRFVLTGFPRVSGQQRTENAIRSLGGEVSSSEEFDPTCTHVICPLPIKTEKFMCALAAGKHMIHSTYIEQSARSGYFLPLESYEWVSIAASSNGTEKLLASAHELIQALLMWSEASQEQLSVPSADAKRRTRRAVGGESLGSRHGACFSQMSAMLVVSNAGRDGLRRLLTAGGAALCSDFREPYCGDGGQRFTHAFISSDLFDAEIDPEQCWGGESVRQQALQRFKELHRDGVRCFRPEFLLDFLIKGPTINVEAYLVRPPNLKIQADHRKRKRESVDHRCSFFEAEPIRVKKRIVTEL